MGWECKMTYSYVQADLFGSSSNYSNILATYTNDSSDKQKINTFWFKAGTGDTGDGFFTFGDKVKGNGQPFKMYVEISGSRCDDDVTISKKVYKVLSETYDEYGNITGRGYIPNDSYMTKYTFKFEDDDVVVDPGKTVTVKGYIVDTEEEPLGYGRALCMDRFGDSIVGGDVETYVNKLTITYYANGGKFSSTGKSTKVSTKEAGSIKISAAPGTRKSYTVTYQTDGGITSSGKTSKDVKCTFAGWNTKQDGSGVTWGASTTHNIQSDTTLWAQWTNPKLGDLPNSCIKENCNFLYWTATSTGTTEISEDRIVTSDMNVYARYSYIIKYNGNGTAAKPAEDVPANGVKQYNQSYTLDKVAPSRPGYAFSYWSRNKDGSGTHFNPGGTYTTNEPTTFYAQWGEPTYDVKFDLKGGTYAGGGSLTQRVKKGQDAVPPNDPTKKGYTFGGWSDDYQNITGNRIIYALWTRCPVWIMTKDDGWVGLTEYLKGN